jgi:hypothetical protein
MGAALTYARRCALFAMVGIAGEDDLGAEEFQAKPGSSTPGPALSPSHLTPDVPPDVIPEASGNFVSNGNGRLKEKPEPQPTTYLIPFGHNVPPNGVATSAADSSVR